MESGSEKSVLNCHPGQNIACLLVIVQKHRAKFPIRFQGPDVLCRAVKFGQVFPLYLSSFVLTLMAVDRVGITGSGLRGVGMSSRATSSAIAIGKVGKVSKV